MCLLNSDQSMDAREDQQYQSSVLQHAQQIAAAWPGHVRVLLEPGSFSRAGTLQSGMDSIQTSEKASLVMTCDADQYFVNRATIDKGLGWVEQGRRFAAPIEWWAAYRTYPETVGKWDETNRKDGFWRIGSQGVLWIHLADIRAIGTLWTPAYLNRTEWGGEDGNVYGVLIKHRLAPAREKYPELIHLFHDKAKWSGSVDGVKK